MDEGYRAPVLQAPIWKGLTTCEELKARSPVECYVLDDDASSAQATEHLDDALSVTSFRSTSTRLSTMYDNELINNHLSSLVRAIKDATKQRKKIDGKMLLESCECNSQKEEGDDEVEQDDTEEDDDEDEEDANIEDEDKSAPSACKRQACQELREQNARLQEVVERLEVENMTLHARLSQLQRCSSIAEPDLVEPAVDKETSLQSVTNEGDEPVMRHAISGTRQARKQLRSNRAARRRELETSAAMEVVRCESFMGQLVDTIEAIQNVALQTPPQSPCRMLLKDFEDEGEAPACLEESSEALGPALVDDLRSAIGSFFSGLSISEEARSGKTPSPTRRRRKRMSAEGSEGN
mmetsp:Transcript_26586/g.48701  ORF Transcript_26586/g.48701 Transcript_26586/m.48701 type:complete len:352 (+) Transcript_26586:51-1106(+)